MNIRNGGGMVKTIRRLYNTAWLPPACFVESRIPWASPDILDWIQSRRVRKIVKFAWKHVPFYRDAMKKRGLTPRDFRTGDDLKLLPLISNSDLRDNPEIFNSDTTDYKKDMLLHAGNYKSIYWSPKAARQWFARVTRTRVVLNALLERSSGYTEVYIHPSNSCNQGMNEYWRNSFFFRGRAAARLRLDMKDPYSDTVEKLNAIRPDIVLSFGSYSEHLLKYIHHNNLSFNPPAIWFYGSDMMSAGMREFIEDKFGCRVYSSYSMNEMGAMSFECEKTDGFHLNTDVCHVRIVDGNGENLPEGEPGEVIVSNLVNTSTVILNYRTGDRGRISGKACSCGRTLPVLKDLYGRINDTVYLADGSEMTFGLLDSLVSRILKDVSSYQIIQERPGHICWRLVPFPGCDRAETSAGIKRLTLQVLKPVDRVEIEWAGELEVTPGHKKRSVIHRFETDTGFFRQDRG